MHWIKLNNCEVCWFLETLHINAAYMGKYSSLAFHMCSFVPVCQIIVQSVATEATQTGSNFENIHIWVAFSIF